MALDPGVIAEFKVMIDASTDKLQREMRGLKSKMYKDGKETASIFNNAFTRNFGIGLSTAAVTGFVKSTLDTADALSKSSKQLGISVENLQKFQFAASQSGIEVAAFNKSLEFLNDNAANAANGAAEQVRVFSSLGINVRNSNGEIKDTVTLLKEVIKALSNVGDSASKINIAKDIFGRGGSSMINLGSMAEVEALLKQREDMGGMVSQRQAEAAERFNDAMSALWTQVRGILGDSIHGWVVAGTQVADEFKKAASNMRLLNEDDKKRRERVRAETISKLSGNPIIGSTQNKANPEDILDMVNRMNAKTSPGLIGTEFGRRAEPGILGVGPAPVTGGVKSAVGDPAGPWPAASLPPRMEMLNLSVSQNTEALKAAAMAAEKLRDAWVSSYRLPTSVTDRFNKIAVQPLFDIGPNGRWVTATRPAPAGGMVQHFYHNNFEAPEMAARKYNAQAALVPRAG